MRRWRVMAIVVSVGLVALACSPPSELQAGDVESTPMAEVLTAAHAEAKAEARARAATEAADQAAPPPPQPSGTARPVAVHFESAAYVPPPPPPTIHPGQRHDEVVGIQERLIEFGYELPRVDGLYDGLTVVAIVRFQEAQGINADGVIGLATWTALGWPKPFEPVPLVTEEPVPGDGAPGDPHGEGPAPETVPVPPVPAGSHLALAVVRLGAQQVDLYAPDGSLVHTFPVSSGRDGLTPVGTFVVQRKSASTISTVDNQVHMNWMVNFYGGIGFHGIPTKHGQALYTPLGERPVSAGCVRMADDAAKLIFDHLPVGATVIVEP